MKTYMIGISLFLLIPSSGQAQWVEANGLAKSNIMCFGALGDNLFVSGAFGGQRWVYRSIDDGTSWQSANTGLTGSLIWQFADIGSYIFAAMSGNGGRFGVFRSTDSGTSWQMVNTGLPEGSVECIAVVGTNIFAVDQGAVGGEVYLSTDSGANWTKASTGLSDTEANNFDIQCLAVSGASVFAGVSIDDGGGVYLTTNNGTSWSEAGNRLATTSFRTIIASGENLFASDHIFGNAYLSTDNGTTWITVDSGLPTDPGISCFAVNGTNVFAGTSHGVFLSTNNGATWATVDSGLTDTNVYALEVFGTDLFAGTDSGVWRRPLSDFATSAVSSTATIENSLTCFPNPLAQCCLKPRKRSFKLPSSHSWNSSKRSPAALSGWKP